MADPVLLCLKCRQKDHDVEHFPIDGWAVGGNHLLS